MPQDESPPLVTNGTGASTSNVRPKKLELHLRVARTLQHYNPPEAWQQEPVGFGPATHEFTI